MRGMPLLPAGAVPGHCRAMTARIDMGFDTSGSSVEIDLEELLASRDPYGSDHQSVVVFKSSLDLKALRVALDRLRYQE